MAEWFKAHAWKACGGLRPSQVRILSSPPIYTFARVSGNGSVAKRRPTFCRFGQKCKLAVFPERSSNKQYLKSLSDEQREIVEKLDKQIKKAVPNLKQKLWEQKLWGGTEVHIIGYGEYTQTYATGREVHWFLIGLTAYKNSFSIYINSVENGKYLAEANRDELGKVKVGKSCIKFKKIEDINLVKLLQIIKRAARNNKK